MASIKCDVTIACNATSDWVRLEICDNISAIYCHVSLGHIQNVHFGKYIVRGISSNMRSEIEFNGYAHVLP